MKWKKRKVMTEFFLQIIYDEEMRHFHFYCLKSLFYFNFACDNDTWNTRRFMSTNFLCDCYDKCNIFLKNLPKNNSINFPFQGCIVQWIDSWYLYLTKRGKIINHLTICYLIKKTVLFIKLYGIIFNSLFMICIFILIIIHCIWWRIVS
jgi:hypothetical protein